jgi:hypothetical protein
LVAVLITSVFTTFLGLPAATGKVTGDNCVETEHGTWCFQTVLSDTEKFDGAGAGDVDNDGLIDVVGVGLNGKVWMATKKSGEWVRKVIWENPGELLIPAIGDADNDGKNEIVVVGMVAGPEADTGAGQVTLLEGSGNNWQATRLWTDTHMLHGCAIGDFDKDHDGNEVVATSFNYTVTEIKLNKATQKWETQHMFTADHKVRTAVVGDVDASNPGNEVVVASKDNNLTIIKGHGTQWEAETVFTDVGGEARCSVGDIDGDGDNDIAGGGDASNLAVVTNKGTQGWDGKVIWTDSDKLRGAWIGDVYDGHSGNEVISAGYSGNVTIHFQESGEWKHVQVFHDENRLHHAITADVDPDRPGLEIVTVGYSNKVTVIGQYKPDLSLSSTPETVTVTSAKKADYKLTIDPSGYFTDDVDLDVSGLPTGATASFGSTLPVAVSDDTIVTMTVNIPSTVTNGDYALDITAASDSDDTITATVQVQLVVNRQIGVTVTAPTDQVAKSKDMVTYIFTIKNNGNVADTFTLAATSQNGWTATLTVSETTELQPGESINVGVSVDVPKESGGKTDQLTFTATSKFDGTTQSTDSVITTVKKDADDSSICGGVIVAVILTIAALGIAWIRRRR